MSSAGVLASTGRPIYVRHTLNHHQFFSDSEMRFRDQRDWRVTVFPPYALAVFTLMTPLFSMVSRSSETIESVNSSGDPSSLPRSAPRW